MLLPPRSPSPQRPRPAPKLLNGGRRFVLVKWKDVIDGNPASFEQIYEANADADIVAIQATADALHARLSKTLSEQGILSPRKKPPAAAAAGGGGA